MAFVPVEVIEVRAWGRSIGAVAPSNIRGAYAFQYFPDWVESGASISPLNLPLRFEPFVFPGLSTATWHGLPPAIADALPDAFGNEIIDAEMARRGARPAQVTALDRLAYTGGRAMGALEFVPDHGPLTPRPTLLDIGELVSVARDVIAGRLGSPDESRGALEQILSIGTSAGGARAKAVVDLDPVTGELRAGTVPRPGTEPWLLKFDGVGSDRQLGETLPYGRVEYAYALMARAAGIAMAPARLLEENGRAHFMSRRFDRLPDGGRLHMQSLCALGMLDFNATGVHDYAQLQGAIRELGLGRESAAEAFRRMVFNYAAANCDDHTKNHAFLMDAEGVWSLAPAYDVTHAYNPDSAWVSRHLMGVDGRFEAVTRAEFVTFAERHGILGAKAIIEQVNDAVARWAEFADEAGVPAAAVELVGRDLAAIA